MAGLIRPGPKTWSMSRDAEGYRTYKIVYLVECNSTDGPSNALATPGLPLPGSRWLVDADIDLWATCRWDAEVTPLIDDGDPNTHFTITFTFSTKPFDRKSCKDTELTDPLLEPQKVSGSFVKYTEEATVDRFNRPITNSAHEQLRGPQVEFDANRPQIKVEQNVALLELELFAPMVDCVNTTPLWGLPARKIKLSNVSWEKKFQGQCQPYFTRTFEFEVRYDGFDRDLLDEGTKVLHGRFDPSTGHWVLIQIAGADPDYHNPSHFDRFKDRQGENCRVILNGRGLPSEVTVGTGNVFMSVSDANVGNALTNDGYWLAVVGDIPSSDWTTTSPTDPDFSWSENEIYDRGEIVLSQFISPPPTPTAFYKFFICLTDGTTSNPEVDAINWSFLGEPPVDGTFHFADKGNFDEGTVYNKGEYVTDLQTTRAGMIHVEKYREAQFLLLGIPTIL